ncbi:substrate-binding domain-containing protein, partial [Methanoregula sp.]|uniref:substrate-binding domain-containing protein n=1 Tax=Methanoregula sp. TaxID=2052170 RepID=UPI000CC94D95
MRKSVHFGLIAGLIAVLFVTVLIAGCTSTPATTTPAATTTAAPAAPVATESGKETLVIATTTSLYDTGLLDYLQPMFEKQYNVQLKITSQGTGKAIEIAKKGDADVLLVHSPSQELAFMKDGYGLNRRSFASNSFIIVGPESDPAGIKELSPEKAFTTLLVKGTNKTSGIAFVSRGDNSGTHSAEKTVWSKAGYNYTAQVQKSGDWYVEAGKGMGETLQMASEKGAYVLTDEGTYLAYKKDLKLTPLVTKGASLLNIYSVMAVYNDKQPAGKIQMANNFINFLISKDTQDAIGSFGVDKYGKALFIPMSVEVPTATAGWVGDYSTPATAVAPAATAAPAAAATT